MLRHTGLSVWAVGLDHTNAPLDLHGRFAFASDRIASSLQNLRRSFSNRHPTVEAAIISTCNRTEIYCAAERLALDHTVDWLAQSAGVASARLRSHAYGLHDGEAARHAFRVASGLDSTAGGEARILGQMKDAVQTAKTAGSLGGTLHQLFQRSFTVAKEVRTATQVGAHPLDMAAAAVGLAARLFEDMKQTRAVFVGAGETIDLAAAHFAARQPRSLVFANRTLERAGKLASRFGGEAMLLAELPARLAEFDIVVSCTASTRPLIGLGAVQRALQLRRHRPMFMVDLAVPRSIEPPVKALEDVYLYHVDDLLELTQPRHADRQAAKAEVIIDAGVQSFMHWLDQRSTVPVIRQLNAQTEDWRAAELARARKLLAKGEPLEAVLEALSRRLAQKMLHGAMAELHAGDGAARAEAAQAISRLFLRNDPKEVATIRCAPEKR